MRALTVDVQSCSGRVLCCSVLRPGGRKLLTKGHTLSEEDIQLLASEGLQELWVSELEESEIGEDAAVLAVAEALCCGSVEIRPSAGGRANILATKDSCILVDEDLLKQINFRSSLVIATLPNYRFVRARGRIATIKSAPFAIAKAELETVLSILRERGAILQARPTQNANVAVLYTDAVSGERARTLFEHLARTRVQNYGGTVQYSMDVVEKEDTVTRSLEHLLRAKPAVILVASTTAPASPEDIVGRSIANSGAQLERFLAPVEPGNLMMLSYWDDISILSAPSCFRSAKPNILDLLLPPLLAKYRICGWEISALGHGGLLS